MRRIRFAFVPNEVAEFLKRKGAYNFELFQKLSVDAFACCVVGGVLFGLTSWVGTGATVFVSPSIMI